MWHLQTHIIDIRNYPKWVQDRIIEIQNMINRPLPCEGAEMRFVSMVAIDIKQKKIRKLT